MPKKTPKWLQKEIEWSAAADNDMLMVNVLQQSYDAGSDQAGPRDLPILEAYEAELLKRLRSAGFLKPAKEGG